MKKLNYVIAFCLLAAIACFPFLKKELNGDNINISVKETKEKYKFSADFNEDRSQEVQEYMDNYLKQGSFKNAQTDAEITLDDRTKFYLKAFPGELRIVLNKQENSEKAYQKIKQMGEGIKGVLAGKK